MQNQSVPTTSRALLDPVQFRVLGFLIRNSYTNSPPFQENVRTFCQLGEATLVDREAFEYNSGNPDIIHRQKRA